jgi:DNA polymerase-1
LKKLTKTLIVDGNSLLQLGFHGLKNFQDKNANLGAVFYFLNTIKKLILEHTFNKVVVTWDGEKNYESRRKMYPDYKIKRVNKRMSDEKRESLYTQKTRIQQYLEEVFIRQCEFKGYEADDCIAFYCLNNNKEDITILTNDRDLTQLISSNVNLKLLNNLNIVKNGDKIKFEKHVVPVENIKLIKIICGDSSDDISGIKSVGIKTMINLAPNILEEIVGVEDFLQICRKKYEDGDNNFRLKNIIKGITKEGKLGNYFFKRNKFLVDLSDSILPDELKEEIKQLINENMDPEGRSYKNLLRMMMDDGLFGFIGNSDESFLNFTEPFLMLTRIEKNKFKKIL